MLNLLNLTVFQFDGGGASEDRHGDFEAGFVFIHFFDHTNKGGKRTIGDPDLLSDFEGDGGLGMFDTLNDLV